MAHKKDPDKLTCSITFTLPPNEMLMLDKIRETDGCRSTSASLGKLIQAEFVQLMNPELPKLLEQPQKVEEPTPVKQEIPPPLPKKKKVADMTTAEKCEVWIDQQGTPDRIRRALVGMEDRFKEELMRQLPDERIKTIQNITTSVDIQFDGDWSRLPDVVKDLWP